MKKCLKRAVFALFFFFSLSVSQIGAQEGEEQDRIVPVLLEGIWENQNRYVVFDTSYRTETNWAIPQIVLRTFYTWYDDRAAESAEYTQTNPRDTNTATDSRFAAEHIELRFTPLTDELFTADRALSVVQSDGDILSAENESSGAWDVEIKYANRKLGAVDTYHVPIAVIGNKLYLHFAIKEEDSDSVPVSPLINGTVLESGSLLDGYWRDYGNASGILVSPPVTNAELLCYYVYGSRFYHIRYWETDMDYDEAALAQIVDGEDIFSVPKHLLVGGKVYTCTKGRRSQIRNIKKSDSFEKSYALNNILVQKRATVGETQVDYTVRTTTICVFGEPYLTLTDGSQSIEEIITLHNARKKPLPAPPFPAHGGVLDYDWESLTIPPERYDRRALDLFR